MARGDEAWVEDIVSAIADIRADTAGMNFEKFSAYPAIIRSILYSIAVIGEEYQPRVHGHASRHSEAGDRWDPRQNRARILSYQHAPHLGRRYR